LHPISVFYIYFYFLGFNKLGVGKEMKIAPLEMDHLYHKMEHVRINILMSFNDSFCTSLGKITRLQQFWWQQDQTHLD
jgi:hypothetical protein